MPRGDSESLNSPAGWISLPSASTRQPSRTSSLVTCSSRLAGSSSVSGSSRGSLASRKPSSNSLTSAADSVRGSRRITRPSSVETASGVVRAGGDHRAVVVEFQLAEQLVGRQPPVLPGGAQGQAGSRLGDDLLKLHRLDQFGRGDAGLGQDAAEHQVLLAARRRSVPSRTGAAGSRASRPGRRTGRRGRRPGPRGRGPGPGARPGPSGCRRGGGRRARPIACRPARSGCRG